MKVTIIGGGGRVGSDAAYALQLGNTVREILLIDANAEMAAGEALDLMQGNALIGNQKIYSGSYDQIKGSDCIIVTAGLRRKPDESRLDLVNRNVTLFRSILEDLRQSSLPEHTLLLVVSNPVDILTYLAIQAKLLHPSKIFGLGTVLDTCRFRSLIADKFNLNPCDVKALVLGEHGDSMVPIWSSATVNGVPLSSFQNFTDKTAQEVAELTRKSGAEVIRLKGGAGRAVGVCIRAVIEAIARDDKALLPVSTLQTGHLGIKDVCLSLPTKMGRTGVIEVMEPPVSNKEQEDLVASAKSLKKVLGEINTPGI